MAGSSSTIFRGQPTFMGGSSFDMPGGDSRFVLELHKHDANSEMLLIEEGEGEFEIDGRSYTAGAGSMLFYHRGIWHKELSTKHPFRCTYIAFTGLQVGELERDFFLSRERLPIIQLHDQLPVIRKLMRDAIAESRKLEPEAQMIASHYLGIIFAKLARLAHYDDEARQSRLPAREAVWKAKRIIEENYSAPLTLDTLAEETYLNKYHLAHLFKEMVGVSPIQFLIYCRIEAAKRYLRTTGLQVKEIAEIVGYQSEPSFYNVFMKVSGMTPKKYREKDY
ncbi:AraC-like DNA-binding protein [Paenibacillus taihuensis]|uniref:AraC-like DNA-binding protein n=1 Tax=Paenibacillus taihuensis TaxID=1156355 RepID=A0A3D9QZT0_9BACL|nr:AraC family transcriptional regulator [Paenibacillus taihuensis]REE66637.1 AraC-like DNA-binding protein [Paenibacillus taihuensis]